MDPKDYNEDTICFAMGLLRYVPSEAGDALRVVFMPSFHPEVCVTVTRERLVAAALQHSLWGGGQIGRMPEMSEATEVSGDEVDRLDAAFDAAFEESKRPPRWVTVCDGMAVSAVRVRGERQDRYAGHALHPGETLFSKAVLSLALSKVRSARLRNRLSWCGGYLHPRDPETFPVEPEAEMSRPRLSHMLVLGAPEDREDFHALVGARDALGSRKDP